MSVDQKSTFEKNDPQNNNNTNNNKQFCWLTMTSNDNNKTTGKCQECREALSLYQCPRCSRRTCSLVCCKAHKARTGCNGKRDRTTYRRLEQMDDSTLQSDFFFLENVLQTVDGGKRLLKDMGARASGGPQSLVAEITIPSADEQAPASKKQKVMNDLPPKWRRLVEQAKERDITLLLMPPGMHRHKSNTTHYVAKTESILWRLEFLVHDDKDDASHQPKVLINNKVTEESKLMDEWNKHMNNFVDEDYHFLLKKLPCPSNKPQYVKIDKQGTLKDTLKGMTVIEYPSICVVKTKDLEKFPLLIQEVKTETS